MAGFDLKGAVEERESEPFAVNFGDGDSWQMHPFVDTESMTTYAQDSDMFEFLCRQMLDDEVEESWRAFEWDKDVMILNQIVGAYFDHIGIPNPYDEKGRLKSAVKALLGEEPASNRSSRRTAKK